MDESTKEDLIVQFRQYLETESEVLSEKETPTIDLFSLFTELSGLRNEIKLESRQVKSALEQFKAVFELLQANQTHLVAEIAQNQAVQTRQSRQEMRQLLLELIELYDRLELANKAFNFQSPKGWFRFCECRTQIEFIHSLREGQSITLRRLTETLIRHQVRSLLVVGKAFDPYRMKATAMDSIVELENGIVIEELRKGFIWGEEILRLAEVKINKLK